MAETVIEFSGVSRAFEGPPPVDALRDCSLRIEKGQLVTVIGPSGSGKSTWLHLAGLLDRPTSGEIRLGGLSTSSMDDRQRTELRAAHIGFVFQSFHLMPRRTVRENLEVRGVYQGMPPSRREEEAAKIGERVGLAHRLDATVGTLSGGEMQRVAIGRALFGEPALLLCDEPTGNLDTATGTQAVALLRSLNEEGSTIVIITHDRELASIGRVRYQVRDGLVSDS